MDGTKILCVTHSSRKFVEARCSINAFEKRFAKKKDAVPPPFESLSGVHDAVPFNGALSLWSYDSARGKLTFLHRYDPNYKIQSAAFRHDQLLVLGPDRIEVLDLDFNVVKDITDPWLAGGHTVYIDERDHAWVTSAPSNCIMKVDVDGGTVLERIVLPAQYGRPYELTPEHDVRRHFIPTDHQPTHVNCAYPAGDNIYVTLLAPGAVGYYDQSRNYHEVVKGYRGCHGGKIDRVTKELYLTDSPSGIIWFFDADKGTIHKRLRLDSLWLHDVEQVEGPVFAAGLSDKNTLLLFDKGSGDILDQADCSAFGQSVMFVSTHTVSQKWMDRLTSAGRAAPESAALGPELLPPVKDKINPAWLNPDVVMHAPGPITLASAKPLKLEYLFLGARLSLPPGQYTLSGNVTCRQGGLTIGLINAKTEAWITSAAFDHLNRVQKQQVTIPADTAVQCVIAACNADKPDVIWSFVEELSLRKVVSKPVTMMKRTA